jgi:ankyrin repeat protein
MAGANARPEKELIVRQPPPTRAMRENPDLDQLKRQAKELLEAFTANEPDAVAEVNAHYHGADLANFALHTAQLVLARSYGFDSWPKLKAYVDGVTIARLCDAVEQGDLAAARDMLRRRPEIVNLERPQHGEHRALHVAVLRRDPAMVRLLMENGADARVGIFPHRDATSALTFAKERGYDEIVAIIHEEELRRRGDRQTTPVYEPNRELDEALWSGDQDRVIALLGADPSLIHRSHPDGWTLLHRAAGILQERVVAWLLEHGADVNRRAQGEWTPLDFAASGRAWDESGSSERFASVAALLLRAGAPLSSVAAVALGDGGLVRARHAEGALVNATAYDGSGPIGGLLTTAVTHNRQEMLALLLDLGLDPDERAREVGTDGEVAWSWGMPLHHCAEFGKFAMAKMLLARGADPNVSVCCSGTPVGVAYGNRHWEMVKLLERHGGVVYAANAGYYRDTELARRLFADEAAGRLGEGIVGKGERLAEVLLRTGATGGDPEIVRMALERIDWPRDDSRWYWKLCDPLCFWNHMPGIPTAHNEFDRGTYLTCFKLVLERCDPNVNPYRSTCLHEVAAMRRHVTSEEVVSFARVLLDAGARLDIRDDLLHSTPLGWACRWGRTDLVKLLLERGADPVEANAQPWATPQAWAEKMGHGDVLAVLRECGR